MARPPFIDPPTSSEEIFHDRRSKKAEAPPPGAERRSRQQFDAIPWWLKVNYSKSQEPVRTKASGDEPQKQAGNK